MKISCVYPLPSKRYNPVTDAWTEVGVLVILALVIGSHWRPFGMEPYLVTGPVGTLVNFGK